jgi:hypothetical protein
VSKPPALHEIALAKDGENIHTFSNGTEWEMWAHNNCLTCRWYELDGAAGEYCGFEGAALLGAVTPEVASLFGWTQSSTEWGPYHGWDAPESCRFHRDKEDDNGEPVDPRVPDICPETLSLFADQRTTADITSPLNKMLVAKRRKVTP